jgi:hypothetical protein
VLKRAEDKGDMPRMARMKAKEDSMIAQLHDPGLRFFENPCANIVHHGLDFSRSV